MLTLSVEYDAKKLLKAFKKVCVPDFETETGLQSLSLICRNSLAMAP